MRDGRFAFEVATRLSPSEAWRRVVDVSRHGEVVPLTRGSGPSPEDARVGSRFVARTSVGPIGFDDVMVLRECVPGSRAVFEKVGRLLGGTIEVDVTPAASGARVMWHQTIVLPRVSRRLRPVASVVTTLVAPVVGAGYQLVVKRLLAG